MGLASQGCRVEECILGKGEVSVGGQSLARGWLPSCKGPLTMVISRRGGGLCLILGDPIKRRDLVSHTMNIIPEVDTKTDLTSPADEVSQFAQASGSGRDPSWGRSLVGAGPRRLGPGRV